MVGSLKLLWLPAHLAKSASTTVCGPKGHSRSCANRSQFVTTLNTSCLSQVDTLGREVMVRRPFTLDESGWPVHETAFRVCAGEALTLTTRQDLMASPTLLPLTHPNFPELVQVCGV